MKAIKKADIIIAVIIIAVCLFLHFLLPKALTVGKTAQISVDNKVVKTCSLAKNRTVKLAKNTVVIKDGYAYVKYADCPDKICKKHKPINKKGETIVCLPNKMIVEIK